MHGIGKRYQPDERREVVWTIIFLSFLFVIHLSFYCKLYYSNENEMDFSWAALKDLLGAPMSTCFVFFEIYMCISALSRWLGLLHSNLRPMPKLTKFNYQQVYCEKGRIAWWSFLYASALSIMEILFILWLSEYRSFIGFILLPPVIFFIQWSNLRFYAPRAYIGMRENRWRKRRKRTLELECYAFADKIKKSR